MQKQSFDIEFDDLTYSTPERNEKDILKSVCGTFYSGNLIGILGPSGAGKTTLLNILAGYLTRGVTGTIRLNGKLRDMRLFHKLSCYIMQEDVLQEHLTVRESMVIAADLKLGNKFTVRQKLSVIDKVAKLIGLTSCSDTRTEDLSGGQKKRLVLALELINDPPVLFLDEPTTGLDNVAMKQCIELLKSLTRQGRTIICTIHQPSDSIFQLFDQVYFMSDGYCIYNGSTSQLVPFLQSIKLPCPASYSPADYIIELVYSNDDTTEILSGAIQNGKANLCDQELATRIIANREERVYLETTVSKDEREVQFATCYLSQVYILLRRMSVQLSRNKILILVQLIQHVAGGLALGISFLGIGNNATMAVSNFKFFIAIMVFYCFTHIMSPALLFPFEIELIRREYFNRWYSLKAYYTALTIFSVPLVVLFGITYNTIIYMLTSQPMELVRYTYFNVVSLLVGLSSYGLGVTIGSTFRPTVGACVGSAIGIPLILLSMYGMGYGNGIEPWMHFFMFLSYARHGLVGISCAIYQHRPALDCSDEIYCYFEDPSKLMFVMGMEDASLVYVILVLVGFLVVLRVAAFVALKRRVTPESLMVSRWF